MTWQLIHLDDVPASPWRNGGGTTRELLAWPGAQDWDWRISVAEVERAGPFSSFPGVRRWFAVLSGMGVRLSVQEPGRVQVHELGADSAPLAFDGGADTGCELIDGPTEDFNLMLREGRGEATLQRIRGSWQASPAAGARIGVYTAEQRATLEVEREIVELPPHTLAWRALAEPAAVQVWSESALWIEIKK